MQQARCREKNITQENKNTRTEASKKAFQHSIIMVVLISFFLRRRLRGVREFENSSDIFILHRPPPLSLSGSRHLPSPLEPAAGAGQRHGLVHHPFTDAQVLVDPLVHLLVVAGDLVCLDTGPGGIPRKKKGHMLANKIKVKGCGMYSERGVVASLTSSRSSASCRPRRRKLNW